MELFTPDVRLEKVEDITCELLESRGITALLIDVDNTLVSRATSELTPSVIAWMQSIKQAGISCCLLSNNWHGVIHEYAAQLGVPIIDKAMKPLPIAYIKALHTIGARRATTAMVGDQFFTDIFGARLCVMPSILVEPLSLTDLWYTKIFRKLEKKLQKQS
ncbi:MAG: YqeG family HAD IIIA-type phosphatase [Coriobacteriales bacterium]|jgi:HAD superfamily phosphatase (TIGR01668 family)|nr:YqeG family HAD IIIA-type phosphatase [Coriobacteriales bacterium]